MFLGKYEVFDLYDEYIKKILIIDNEELQSDKRGGLDLIEITGETNGSMSYHECFSSVRIYLIEFNQLISKIIFNWRLSQMNPIKNSQYDETNIGVYKICNNKRNFGNNSPHCTL